MRLLIITLALAPYLTLVKCNEAAGKTIKSLKNVTQPDKDLYVIHATVYQVGILTNKTDNMTDNFNTTGNQESVTLFHTNGTNVDLGAIPEPLLTNVTAQSLVGVAPVSDTQGNFSMLPPWSFGQFTSPPISLGNASTAREGKISPKINKRSLNNYIRDLFKRDTKNNTPVKVVNGTALIPPEAGIQSIGLPPLLTLNNNLSEIPVPIPNTSVVHYAKVNTLIQKP